MEIKRFNLNFDKTHRFFKENLSETNYLSSTLLELLDFKSGIFFTILPKRTESRKMHQFKYGGIAKGVIEQIRQFLFGKLLLESKTACIFDDVSATYDNSVNFNYPLFTSYGLILDKEVYYLVRSKDVSLETINDCFNISNALWHSLCVVTKIDFVTPADKVFTDERMAEVCNNAELIILYAYDGEGYVFWEKMKDET